MTTLSRVHVAYLSPSIFTRAAAALRRPLYRAVIACLAFVTPYAAEAGQAAPVSIAPVVVSGTRFARATVNVPTVITVITRQDIEDSGANSIQEVLRDRGGVQLSNLYGNDSKSTVDMRGFGATATGNTLVLVDGRRLNNPDTAPPDLSGIKLEDVQRIEIVEGSAGVLYGDQAVGGVINIITRKPHGFTASVEAGAGSYGGRDGNVGVSQRLANGFSYRITGEKRRTDNYRDHNRDSYSNGFARVAYRHATGSLFAEVQRVGEYLQLPGVLTAAQVAANPRQIQPGHGNDFTSTHRAVERVGLRQSLTDTLAFEAEVTNRSADVSDLLGGTAFTEARHVRGFTPRLTGAWPLTDGDLLLTAGYDMTWASYRLNIPPGQFAAFTTSVGQQQRGIYTQLVIPVLPRLSLTVGARRASLHEGLLDSGAFPAGVTITDHKLLTEAGLSFRPTSHWRLFARRADNVRFPKADELNNASAGTILKTQTGVSWELGAEWHHGNSFARVEAYRLDLHNEIAAVPSAANFGFPLNTNLPPTRHDGLVVGTGWQATGALRLSADWSFTDAHVRQGPLAGNRVPGVSRNNLRLAAEYRPHAHWLFTGEWLLRSNQVFGGDFNRKLGYLPGYGVANLVARYTRGDWTFTGRLNNVLDKHYSETGARGNFPAPYASFYPAPGRNFWLSILYRFKT